mmetsp:Transcript_36039/g.59695  ORF Transcript_36039/g.59695 Transcript_36039/m.59695 type:complete len:531 (+) Transcript_36039:1-1593(+)
MARGIIPDVVRPMLTSNLSELPRQALIQTKQQCLNERCTFKGHIQPRNAELQPFTAQLWTCALLPPLCSFKINPDKTQITLAAAVMYAMASKTHWMLAAAAACFLLGIAFDGVGVRRSTYTRPLILLKMYVCLLLLIEIALVPAPQLTILSVPELVYRLGQSGPPRPHPDFSSTPPIAAAMLTRLGALGCRRAASALRQVLLWGWCIFLALPDTGLCARASAFAFGGGVAAYWALSSLAAGWDPLHCNAATQLFLPAVWLVLTDFNLDPSLGWLAHYGLHSVLLPSYLCAGLSKLRYDSYASQISGAWLQGVVGKDRRNTYIWLSNLISSPELCGWGHALMSVGNLIFELALPFAIVAVDATPDSGRCCGMKAQHVKALLQGSWLASALLFHWIGLRMLGVNFVLNVLLVVFVCVLQAREHAVKAVDNSAHRADASLASTRRASDWRKATLSWTTLLSWYAVQLWSDISHLSGATAPQTLHNPIWPVPEMAMFISNRMRPNNRIPFMRSLVVVVATAAAHASVLLRKFKH